MRRTLLLILLVACNESSGKQQKAADPQGATRKLGGVYPENFKCDSVTTPDALAGVLGGTARYVEGALHSPRGVPDPCNYEITGEGFVQYWTYDIDCRDGMEQRANALFAQYTEQSADLVKSFNEAADAGFKPNDSGVEIKPPENAAEVSVGAKALDHHGRGLIFIDDDAPCYVRVVGPDFDKRLALAKLVAKNLTFANAPMTPRPMP